MSLDNLIDKIEEIALSIFRGRFTKEDKEKLKKAGVKLTKAARYKRKFNVEDSEPVRDKNGFLQRVEEGETGLLIIQITIDYIFAGYTDDVASEKKIFRDVFEKGDVWLNGDDLMRNIGYNHAQFIDRLGDTFRWKGENVSTSEIEDVLCSFEQIDHSSVYGVEIPGTEGRAGMASILANVDVGYSHTTFSNSSFENGNSLCISLCSFLHSIEQNFLPGFLLKLLLHK